jgi:hypothetical protein
LITLWPPGKELFYSTPDGGVLAVEFDLRDSNFVVGKTRELFSGRAFGNAAGAASLDGKRWLLPLPVNEVNASPLILTTNWVATLKR